MRKYTAWVAAAVACGLIVATVAWAATTLTVVSWGGAYFESQKKAYQLPYTKETGVQFANEDKSANALAGLRAQQEAGNVTWDLVDILEGPAIRACDEGIAEEIDYDKVLKPAPDGTPPTKDFIEGSLTGCFIPQIVYATLFAYNDQMFAKDKPQTVADVFDLKKFPGKRGLEKGARGNLEWALAADGVPYDKIYEVLSTEEGVARAFAKLDTIKSQVVWWSAGAQPPQLLADKEVSIASGYNGRFFNAQVAEKQPLKIIWDGELLELDGWVVPKGTKHLDEVMKFLAFATDTQRLADQAKYISYGPARKSSMPLVSTYEGTDVEMKPHMPTTPEHMKVAIKLDATWWADNGDSMNERFNAWLAKSQ